MKVKNNTANAKSWAGQEIQPGEYYTISIGELAAWQKDDSVLSDIATTSLVVNDGTSDLNAATGIKFLIGSLVEITKQPEPSPFAQPTYRTKMAATANLVEAIPGNGAEITYLMTAERYVQGGSIIVKNAEMGDYITASVEDLDGVIPAPYRPALCEAWPIISTYIEKQYLHLSGNQISIHKIDTYPLNAKITPGLYLTIHYYAVNTGQNRSIAVNYHMTRKL